MIGHLSGKIIKKTDGTVIIDTNGVGYNVNVLPQVINQYKTNSQIKLYTHQYVREDQLSLYGFEQYSQLKTFEILISISGIGPKLGFNIVSTTTPKDIKRAIASADITILSRIPGIGKKSASKILLELSNKLKIDHDLKKIILNPEDELAIEALINLGFNRSDALKAIQRSSKSYDKLEDKIKAGLRILNRI